MPIDMKGQLWFELQQITFTKLSSGPIRQETITISG